MKLPGKSKHTTRKSKSGRRKKDKFKVSEQDTESQRLFKIEFKNIYVNTSSRSLQTIATL